MKRSWLSIGGFLLFIAVMIGCSNVTAEGVKSIRLECAELCLNDQAGEPPFTDKTFDDKADIQTFVRAIDGADKMMGELDYGVYFWMVIAKADGSTQKYVLNVGRQEGTTGLLVDTAESSQGYEIAEEPTEELRQLIYGAASEQATSSPIPETPSAISTKATPEPCLAIVEWVDFVMINDIKYYRIDEAERVTVAAKQLGDKVGEVSYMLSDLACPDHVTVNGDAAFLPIGTEIYAMKGYSPDFRVAADNKLYQVNENPKAKTMGDLYDIEGKVVKVSLNSGIDGSEIGDFSEEASETFVRELLPQPYIGFDKVYEKIKHETGIFLRVHLEDGSSFQMVYYPKGNAFTAGAFGTETLKELIVTQRQQIKAAAGL